MKKKRMLDTLKTSRFKEDKVLLLLGYTRTSRSLSLSPLSHTNTHLGQKGCLSGHQGPLSL